MKITGVFLIYGMLSLVAAAILTTMSSSIPDGTLLFVEGGSQIVMDFTDSPYSHVAIIFNEDGVPYVYEATKPTCRKVKLEEYMKEIKFLNEKQNKQMRVWIKKPLNLSNDSIHEMKDYCKDQLGRKYRVSSYLSGKSTKGIHCGEMTMRSMIMGGMNPRVNPCKCSPHDIMELSSKWYNKAEELSRFPSE